MIRKYAEIFCWKNVSSFCSAKATHIFSTKNIRILYIESAKTVNEMTLNELVKLTMLWTTGPRLIWALVVWICCRNPFLMTWLKYWYKDWVAHSSHTALKMSTLMFTTLWLIQQMIKYWHFSYFYQITGYNISYKLSPVETFYMKCQNLLFGKNKKKKNQNVCWNFYP